MIKKILCVDDDPITLMLYKMVIAKATLAETVIVAKNGQEALEYYESKKTEEENEYPELIFLDLNMPIMGGWEFLDNFTEKRFSPINDKTKIIVLSSTIDPKDIEKVKNYPIIIDFISKPVTKEMLEKLKERL